MPADTRLSQTTATPATDEQVERWGRRGDRRQALTQAVARIRQEQAARAEAERERDAWRVDAERLAKPIDDLMACLALIPGGAQAIADIIGEQAAEALDELAVALAAHEALTKKETKCTA